MYIIVDTSIYRLFSLSLSLYIVNSVIKHYLVSALPQTPDGKEKKNAPGGRGNMQYSAHAVNLQLSL